jgi:hypothetical protein
MGRSCQSGQVPACHPTSGAGVHKTFQRGVAAVVLAGSASMASAQVFSEGFDDVAALVSADFALRLLGGGYLDTAQVYASNSGASTVPASFSLLASYAARSDTGWLNLSLTLPAMDGRIGFRYVVADTEAAGNDVGLDSLAMTGVVPEPASALSLAPGAAGLLLRRRAER